MKVKLTTDRVNSRGWYEAAGTVVDLPHKEAKRLIENGSAVPIRQAQNVEMTTTSRRRPPKAETTAQG